MKSPKGLNLVFAVAAAAVGFSAPVSHAQDVHAGLDFLETRPLTQAVAGGPTLPSIPAGFFGPGSDPFTGTVLLKGVPLANGDTVVRRLADAPWKQIPNGWRAPKDH